MRAKDLMELPSLLMLLLTIQHVPLQMCVLYSTSMVETLELRGLSHFFLTRRLYLLSRKQLILIWTTLSSNSLTTV